MLVKQARQGQVLAGKATHLQKSKSDTAEHARQVPQKELKDRAEWSCCL